MNSVSSNGALLRARGVTKRYGAFTAVDGVDLAVMPGTIHSVIGPNGAGKTTLFHTLTGTVPITAGSILMDGEEVSRLAGYKRVQRGMARSFQVTSLFQNLSVRENLRVAAQGRAPHAALFGWGIPGNDDPALVAADELLLRFSLGPVSDRAVGLLSHGQQRRLEVAMAMAARPRLIFLDEPTSGMGIDDIAEMKDLIFSLRQDGYAILLIEHNMDIVMGISDTITVMQTGRVLVEGAPEAIRNDEHVRRAYLGNMITGGRQ
ncbi:ABC transporter ATP-binding protein [Herbaspirillum sp. YR522]|uniref:ABC transporter ATP-binding protein n=1 Tax=Herbaspirillum sp. YR522 TaxID=1144342 RepID=UPI00026FAB80|nr:ABC transporter ATP-binding protein [Herbaspirillum sp. YR522]EJM95985.1 ABC-type branched-chain amino acid transport system, ATPase component [Herbaspirillum sp. YR522]